MTASSGNGTVGGVVRPQVADRITVTLIREAEAHLQRLMDRTGLSKTDLVNRAITLYEFVDGQQRAGRDLLVRDKTTRLTQTVLIF